MSIESIINKWLNETKLDLAANYRRLGLKASGDWEKALDTFNTQSGGNIKAGITGKDYTDQLENGRRPNRNQSEEALKAWVGWAGSTVLKDWVADKGLQNKLSPYAVAWKIAREGWKVPNKHNAGGLVSDVVTPQRIDELGKELALFTVDGVRSDIIKTLGNAGN